MSALLLTTLVRVWLSLWLGEVRLLDGFETDAMWMSAGRMLQHDIHAATEASAGNGQLQLTLADGTVYVYQKNSNGQLVRVRTGGGTAVAAAGVQGFQAGLTGRLVWVRIDFVNGNEHMMEVGLLTG
jgi:hypothetical protein